LKHFDVLVAGGKKSNRQLDVLNDFPT